MGNRFQDRLSQFQTQIDLTPYIPSPDAPNWLQSLAIAARDQMGVYALLGPAGISLGTINGTRIRASLDPACLFLAGLACRIRGTGTPLAVGLPPVGRHLPLLLASAAVLDDVLDRYAGISTSDIKGNVLIVSPDLDVRSRYCDLYVKSQPLDQAYPGSRLLMTGERIALKNENGHTSTQGVTFFLPGLTPPRRLDLQPSLIILDLRYGRWSKRAGELAQWVMDIRGKAGVMALYTLGDYDTLSALSKAQFLDLPLDHSALATCAERVTQQTSIQPGLVVDWQLQTTRSDLERLYIVREVPDSEAITEIITNIGGLLDEHSHTDNLDLHRAKWLLATLTHLPLPTRWYEQSAAALGRSTLKRMIGQLGIQSRQSTNLGAVIQTLRMQFDALYRILERSNPRTEAVLALLPELVEQMKGDGDLLFLVRDKVIERGVQGWLTTEAFPNEDLLLKVDVRACPNFASVAGHRYSTALVNGAFPRRYRWIAGSPLADTVTFLAYPYEIDVAERQLQEFYSEHARTIRKSKRDQALSKLVPHVVKQKNGTDVLLPDLVFTRPKPTRSEPPKAELKLKTKTKNIADLARVFDEVRQATEHMEEIARKASPVTWIEDAADEDAPEDLEVRGLSEASIGDVQCLQVNVNSRIHGSGHIWMASNDMVECARASTPDDILQLPPDLLRPGDVILRMDEAGRGSLFDHIVGLAEDQPKMQYLGTFRRAWRQAIDRVASKYRETYIGVNYTKLLQDLRRAGATITSEQAIRCWVQGEVIGPDDVSSIKAVGHVSGVDILVHQAKQFDIAFRTIRSLRRGIGRRLNDSIRQSFRHFAESAPRRRAEQLDDRLGLPLDELLETIDLAEVVSIGVRRRVTPSLVGRFRLNN